MAKRAKDNGDRKRDNRGYLESDSVGFNGDLLVYPGFFSPEGLGGEPKMEKNDKEKLTVEDIGDLVRNSGFTADKKTKEAVLGFLERLSNFMQIEKKNGDNDEAVIRKLLSEGILSEEEAKKALEKLNGKKTGSGGIKYEESQRSAVNFSRTCVNHVIRLVKRL